MTSKIAPIGFLGSFFLAGLVGILIGATTEKFVGLLVFGVILFFYFLAKG
ncbi:MAG: hypothetical protein HY397_02985 [Candidatus Doudnabacteria bacterium]|nr:hypothetical protein [Candidatus Doudnabacteria bacterium]